MGAVHDILEHTPNLEVLSLYMAEKEQRQVKTIRDDGQKDDDVVVVDPDAASFSTTCLR